MNEIGNLENYQSIETLPQMRHMKIYAVKNKLDKA